MGWVPLRLSNTFRQTRFLLFSEDFHFCHGSADFGRRIKNEKTNNQTNKKTKQCERLKPGGARNTWIIPLRRGNLSKPAQTDDQITDANKRRCSNPGILPNVPTRQRLFLPSQRRRGVSVHVTSSRRFRASPSDTFNPDSREFITCQRSGCGSEASLNREKKKDAGSLVRFWCPAQLLRPLSLIPLLSKKPPKKTLA